MPAKRAGSFSASASLWTPLKDGQVFSPLFSFPFFLSFFFFFFPSVSLARTLFDSEFLLGVGLNPVSLSREVQSKAPSPCLRPFLNTAFFRDFSWNPSLLQENWMPFFENDFRSESVSFFAVSNLVANLLNAPRCFSLTFFFF